MEEMLLVKEEKLVIEKKSRAYSSESSSCSNAWVLETFFWRCLFPHQQALQQKVFNRHASVNEQACKTRTCYSGKKTWKTESGKDTVSTDPHRQGFTQMAVIRQDSFQNSRKFPVVVVTLMWKMFYVMVMKWSCM